MRRRSRARRATFRHPPSPLQDEVNLVLKASTWLMIPLAVVLIFALQARSTPLHDAAQTATAGLITLIPEGLVLLMSVTLAVAAVRLARLDTLVQQMSAHRGPRRGRHDLRRQDRDADQRRARAGLGRRQPTPPRRAWPSRRWRASPPAPASATGRWRRSPRPTRRPASGSGPRCRSPRSGSGAASPWAAARPTCSARPDVLMARGSLALPVPAAAEPRGAHAGGTAGGRLRPRLGRPARQPVLGPAAGGHAAGADRARGDAATRRPRDDRATCATRRWT